jgi:hypothetical protein
MTFCRRSGRTPLDDEAQEMMADGVEHRRPSKARDRIKIASPLVGKVRLHSQRSPQLPDRRTKGHRAGVGIMPSVGLWNNHLLDRPVTVKRRPFTRGLIFNVRYASHVSHNRNNGFFIDVTGMSHYCRSMFIILPFLNVLE